MRALSAPGPSTLDQVGVCQDFAHLTIAMLHSVGIASRYVSGYFAASDPTNVGSADTDEIVVATHAWVELAVPGWGWWAIDPTNASPVGERHVKIGHGRVYDDVTPLRGVYYGESDHHLAAEVTMSTSHIVRSSVPEVELGPEALLQQ
jgi:transglutaminase-like putative cysteine protease